MKTHFPQLDPISPSLEGAGLLGAVTSVLCMFLLCSCASKQLSHEIPPGEQSVFDAEGMGESLVLSYEDHASLWEVRRTAGTTTTRYIYFPTGLIQYVKQSQRGRAHGMYRRWSDSGILLESGQFENGHPVGVWYEYNADGTLKGRGGLLGLGSFKTSDRIFILTLEHYAKGPDWEEYE